MSTVRTALLQRPCDERPILVYLTNQQAPPGFTRFAWNIDDKYYLSAQNQYFQFEPAPLFTKELLEWLCLFLLVLIWQCSQLTTHNILAVKRFVLRRWRNIFIKTPFVIFLGYVWCSYDNGLH